MDPVEGGVGAGVKTGGSEEGDDAVGYRQVGDI
jgi:hypothetical protein